MKTRNSADKLLMLLLVAVLRSVDGAPAGAAGSLDLAITLSKTDCVAREPLALRATLTNISSEIVGVMEVGYIGRQMDYFYMEVARPDGSTEQRATRWFQMTGVTNPSYPGEPLGPGESIDVFFYPAYSDSRVWTGKVVDPFTFRSPGVYRLTLVYDVAKDHPELATDGGTVRSNEIVLTVRAPDPIEEEILDVLWEGDLLPNAPETDARAAVDANGYMRILEKYPDHEFSNHVRLRLAAGLIYKQADVAVELLVQLREQYPEFRPGETSILLALSLVNLQRHAEAVEIMEERLARDPNLRSNYSFMQMYLIARYPGARENPVTQWRVNRLRGVERPEEHIRTE